MTIPFRPEMSASDDAFAWLNAVGLGPAIQPAKSSTRPEPRRRHGSHHRYPLIPKLGAAGCLCKVNGKGLRALTRDHEFSRIAGLRVAKLSDRVIET